MFNANSLEFVAVQDGVSTTITGCSTRSAKKVEASNTSPFRSPVVMAGLFTSAVEHPSTPPHP